MLSQCIFCVSARAYAEEEGYRELISDYVVFKNPTAIAAGEDLIAVFDSGDIILFDGETRTSFPTGVNTCDELCVSRSGVFLLVDADSANARILTFSLEGEPLTYAWSTEHPSDIALVGDNLYLSLSYFLVKKYTLSTEESEDITISKKMLYLSADEDALCLQTLRGTILKKSGEEETEYPSIGIAESKHFLAAAGSVYYKSGSDLKVMDGEGALLPFLTGGTGDDAFLSVTDFAASDGKMYVLDGERLAVKIFDLSSGDFIRMIGSYGYDLYRLKDPVALSVRGKDIVVVDSMRGTLFSGEKATAYTGRTLVQPTDVVMTGEKTYLADGGKLIEYNGASVSAAEYPIGTDGCRYVAASPDGTVYASSGNEVYRKMADESEFNLFLMVQEDVSGLQVGIGGKILYIYAGGRLGAYSQDGIRLGGFETEETIRSFAVDYRGNAFLLSAEGKILKYSRVVDGYAEPVRFDLAADYSRFCDIALDESGRMYVVADHNILIYPKSAFGVFVAEDSDFKDDVPNESPLFVCETVRDSVISYMTPDNFEDIMPSGTKLMCYATVTYQGTAYLRVETEKGKAYLPKGDVKIFEQGTAPIKKARCLIPSIGTNVVGVNLYKEPSHIAIENAEEPLFAALGAEDVFDVISLVAVDEEGRDVWKFYRVSYKGEQAYVLVSEVVSVDDEPQPAPPRYTLRIRSEGLGKTVPVYKEASLDSEVVVRLTDGTEISAIEEINKENAFTMVLYKGEVCYVQSSCLGQGGLSGGQILAIVLSVAAVVGSVLTVLILRANKRHKRYHKE